MIKHLQSYLPYLSNCKFKNDIEKAFETNKLI